MTPPDHAASMYRTGQLTTVLGRFVGQYRAHDEIVSNEFSTK